MHHCMHHVPAVILCRACCITLPSIPCPCSDSRDRCASCRVHPPSTYGASGMCRGWPTAGAIVYDRVSASYRPGLPPVLRDLCFSIEVCLTSYVNARWLAGGTNESLASSLCCKIGLRCAAASSRLPPVLTSHRGALFYGKYAFAWHAGRHVLRCGRQNRQWQV